MICGALQVSLGGCPTSVGIRSRTSGKRKEDPLAVRGLDTNDVRLHLHAPLCLIYVSVYMYVYIYTEDSRSLRWGPRHVSNASLDSLLLLQDSKAPSQLAQRS